MFYGALGQQGVQLIYGARLRRKVGQHFPRFLGVHPAGQHLLLRAAHFCRRDHLHSPRHLRYVFYTLDSSFYVT